MFRHVVTLVRRDIDRQAQWARDTIAAHAKHAAMTAAFGVAAALAAVGTIVVGLIMLYVWAEPQYGPIQALALVAAVLGGATLLLLALALFSGHKRRYMRPELQVTDTSSVAGALRADASDALSAARQSHLGPAIRMGEQALETGQQAFHAGRRLGPLPRPTLVSIGIAALVGVIVGRRL